MNRQIDEMAKIKKCKTCVHSDVCQELEEFRDPLGWISTEGEFVCSYYDADYRKSSDLAMEIFEEIEAVLAVHAYTSKSEDYSDGAYDALEWVDEKLAELRKKYESEGVE